jgi:hypothetical protein
MNFLEFRNRMETFRVFSISDIEKMFPDFLRLNLINWQKKGFVIKIRREWYCFTDQQIHDNLPWLAANLIYQPSYISLHTALSFYNLIPEAVYIITSVTTKKTNRFNTPISNFSYNTVKKSVFGFGHRLLDFNFGSGSSSNNISPLSRKILFAELEKAVLDFFYINHQYKTEKDMEHIRFDDSVLENNLDKPKFFGYLDRFKSKALDNRVFKMLKVYSIM